MNAGTTIRLTPPLTGSQRRDVRVLIDQARREFNRRRYSLDFDAEVEAARLAFESMTPKQVAYMNAGVAA